MAHGEWNQQEGNEETMKLGYEEKLFLICYVGDFFCDHLRYLWF
jgi:hypothetical protein